MGGRDSGACGLGGGGAGSPRTPTAPAADEILIEAAPGLGEAVVSGAVTPDRFVIERASLELRRPETRGTGPGGAGDGGAADGAAPCLAPDQLRELTSLALRVEEHFGHPVDIEWAWADGGFALLQARRIRGLETARLAEECRAGEEARLRALAGGGRRLWVIHNLAETLRHPTPLSWDLWRRFMGAGGGFGVLYRSLGYRPPPPARDQGFLELIGGFIYADPERLAGFFWDGMPLAYDLDALAADPSLIEAAPSEFDPARADGRFLRKLPANLLAMWRAGRALRRAERDARRRFEEEALPPFLAYVDAKRRQNLAALPDAGVLEELRAREGAVLDGFAPESLRPGFLGALAFARLRARLAQFLGEEDGNALASRLTRSLEGDTTFAQDALLWRTARGEAPMSEFLERYGHRAAGEMELAEPRWREYPAPVERLARRLAAAGGRGPEEVHREGVRERLAAQAELPALLERAGASSLREEVERDLAAAQALLPYRESGKHYLMMGYELLRRAAEELARRWELGGGVYYLRLEELPELPRDAGRLRDAIEERRKRREAMRRIDLPAVIDSRRLDELRRQDGSGAAGAAELAGTPLAAGAATGTARIVLEPDDAAELEGDAILVCPSTDPGWTPLFFSVRGLVVERGGVLSHGAIVARDFGIPAVACPGATRLLRSGDRVRLDGKTGRVTVLARGGSRA